MGIRQKNNAHAPQVAAKARFSLASRRTEPVRFTSARLRRLRGACTLAAVCNVSGLVANRVARRNGNSIHVVMLQDASHRFDVSQNNVWITTRRQSGETHSAHWVQPAMIGEYTVAVPGRTAEAIRVELLGQQGLEPLGHGRFLQQPVPDIGGARVPTDSLTAAVVVARLLPESEGRPARLVLRAQLRGERPGSPFINDGAYAHFRITGVPTPGR
jgi:hypothetical protein